MQYFLYRHLRVIRLRCVTHLYCSILNELLFSRYRAGLVYSHFFNQVIINYPTLGIGFSLTLMYFWLLSLKGFVVAKAAVNSSVYMQCTSVRRNDAAIKIIAGFIRNITAFNKSEKWKLNKNIRRERIAFRLSCNMEHLSSIKGVLHNYSSLNKDQY
ncbi:hypothetical protein BH11BAC6_BH11BAC6_07800 [soil metagenome]